MEVLSASSSSLEVISTQSLTSLADTPPDTEQLSSLVESVASAHSVGTQTEDDSSIVSEVTSHDTQSARSEVKTTQWRPTPAPRRSITPKSAVRAVKLHWIFLGAPLKVNGAPRNIQGNFTALPSPFPRTLSASYSTDFESSHTLDYSDDFESHISRSQPATSRQSADYSDDFDTSTSYSRQPTSRKTQDYSEDFESITTFTSRPARKSIELVSARTSATYSQSFESYGTSESTEDESHDRVSDERSVFSSARTETAQWDSAGTTTDYSGARVLTATRDSYMSESEGSDTGSDDSTFTETATYTQDTFSDESTYEEISEATKQAEADAIAAFVARKLGQLTGSGSGSEGMTPHPPATPRPSANGSTPRGFMTVVTPRTPRVVAHPTPTPRKSLTKESEEYYLKKIQLLRQKLSQPQAKLVEEPSAPKRWWDEVGQHTIEDYGFPKHKFAKLQTESFLRKMEAVANTKIHQPKKCPECKHLAAEAQLRDFVKSKFAVVSEKHIQEKMKNPNFFLGDVITWLGENLQAMPRIHAPPKETLERLMRPLQDNYIMMKRVSVDVADEAARVCGAPTDREEFWKYYMKRFYESPLYEAHCGVQKAERQQEPEEINEHIKKMRKETLRKLSQAEELADQSESDYSETSEWEGSKSQQEGVESDNLFSERSEAIQPERSSTPHSPRLRSALRSTSNSPSRMRKSRSVSFSDDSESFHPNIHNITDLQMADSVEDDHQSNMAHLQLADSFQDGHQSYRSAASRDSDSYKPKIFNIDSLQLAPSPDDLKLSPKSKTLRPSVSFSEDADSYKPNIYNIGDLQLADSLDDLGGGQSVDLNATQESLDSHKSTGRSRSRSRSRSGPSPQLYGMSDSISPPSDLDDSSSYHGNPVYSIDDL